MRIIKLFKYTSDFKSNFRAWEAYAIVIFITKTNHYFFSNAEKFINMQIISSNT